MFDLHAFIGPHGQGLRRIIFVWKLLVDTGDFIDLRGVENVAYAIVRITSKAFRKRNDISAGYLNIISRPLHKQNFDK